MLSDIPKAELVNKVEEMTHENEEFAIINNCLYFHSSVGYGNSKFNLNWFEKKLNLSATSRNYNTMKKLLLMSQ